MVIPRLKRSEEGNMELPLKLMIMTLMIGLIIPASIIGYRDINRMRVSEQVRQELGSLVAFSRKISREGNLSSIVIELDLSGDIFAQVGYVDVGDYIGGESWMVRYSMSWDDVESHIAILNPLVHLTSRHNNTLRLTSETQEIKLTNLVTEEKNFVVVSDVDVNIDISAFK